MAVGAVATDSLIPFSQPGSLSLHPCLAPALRYHCLQLLVSALLPCPTVSVQTALPFLLFSSLTSPSPACPFLWGPFLLGCPRSAAGFKGAEEELAEEKHLGQPRSSTESLKAGSLKHQAVKLYQDQTDLARARNSARLRWISGVAKALLLPNFMLFLQHMGPLGLSKEDVAVLFNVREAEHFFSYTC